MGNFHINPLFRLASRTVQRSARREWQRTTAAKAIGQVRSALNSGKHASAGTAIRDALTSWGRGGLNDTVRNSLLSNDFGRMVREVERYARLGGSTAQLLGEFLSTMGPVGSLIRSLVTSGGRARKSGLGGDIQTALDFLDAVAPDMLSTRGRKASRLQKPIANRSAREVADQIEAAKEFLETHGYEVKPQAGKVGAAGAAAKARGLSDEPTTTVDESTYPGGVSKTTGRGQPRKVIDVDFGDGSRRRFPATHPIVTKEMVRTPQSSNVYSYSYDVDTWTLYVRFQSHMVYGVAGSLYSYANVRPQKFLGLHAAASKGGWVWDSLRIRGTISGHQHDYQLVGVRNNYVPRKATMTAEGEMYVQRTVRVKSVSTGKIKVLTSGATMKPSPFNFR